MEGIFWLLMKGKAAKDSVFSPEVKTFDGYITTEDKEPMFHLVSDNAVFQIVYKKNGSLPGTLPTRGPPDGVYSHLCHGGRKGPWWLRLPYGKKGEKCELEADILAQKCQDYHVASGQETSWTIGDAGSNVLRYCRAEPENRPDAGRKRAGNARGYSLYDPGLLEPNNEILKETTGKADKGDAITLEAETFDGYTAGRRAAATGTLETDGQIFHIFYTKNSQEEKVLGKKEETGEKSLYTIYHVATDGTVLKKEERVGTSGEEIAIAADTFDGYEEADGQTHTSTLKSGVSAFTIMYRTKAESKNTLSYTIRYADMDGTVLKETTGTALRGDRITIPEQPFDGEREIEHQPHEVTLLNDGSVFAIKYEKPRSQDPEEDMGKDPGKDQEETRDENENKGSETDGDLTQDEPQTLASAARRMAKKTSDSMTVEEQDPEEELLDYRIDFQTEKRGNGRFRSRKRKGRDLHRSPRAVTGRL